MQRLAPVLLVLSALAIGGIVALVLAPHDSNGSGHSGGSGPAAVAEVAADGRRATPAPPTPEGVDVAAVPDALAELRAALAEGRDDAECLRWIDAVAVPGAAAVPVLRDALTQRPQRLGSAVLRALETIDGPEAAAALVELARGGGPLAEQAQTVLSRLSGREAAPVLLRAIEAEGKTGPVAVAALRALGKTRLRQHLPLILSLATDSGDDLVRRAAIEAVGRIGDPAALETLGRLLRETDRRLRRSVLKALGTIRSPRAVELLEAALAEETHDLERQLIHAALAGQRGEPTGRFR